MNKILLAGFTRLCIAACAAASTLTWADPPSRVGRISYAEGEASFYSDREEGWAPARLNFPVTSENSLWTAAQGRAEVRIGASALRIDDNTILDFVKVDDDNIDTYLQRGTLNIRTRNYGGSDSRDRIRIDTSEGRFVIDGNGRYRLDTAQDGGQIRMAVFAGHVRYEGGGNALTIDAGKSLLIRSGAGNSTTDFRFENARESAFDRWAEARDLRWDETHTRYVREQSVSPYMTGYEDLDAYGDWAETREYGRVWTPRVVASGWTPYRYGSWAYVNPWGWTWVDDAPWGFAPFHYGRWVQIGVRWTWCPGSYVGRPVYAPALVGWMGERPGVHVSISIGPSIGWFPLAPHEYYVPAYTNNITYIRNINNITNNVTIVNPPARYTNQAPGSTFVNGRTFVSSRPIQANLIRTNPLQVSSHPVVTAPEPPGGAWNNLRARALQQSPVAAPAPQATAASARPQSVAPSYSPQFAPPAGTVVRPMPPGVEARRGAPWQEHRPAPQPAAPVILSTPAPAPMPVPQVPPSAGSARPNALPPRDAAATVPSENSRMRGPRSFDPGEQRPPRPQRPQGNRDEQAANRVPEAPRTAEINRQPVSDHPIESRPPRAGPPAAAPAAPTAAPPAAPAPRPLPRHKQEQLRESETR